MGAASIVSDVIGTANEKQKALLRKLGIGLLDESGKIAKGTVKTAASAGKTAAQAGYKIVDVTVKGGNAVSPRIGYALSGKMKVIIGKERFEKMRDSIQTNNLRKFNEEAKGSLQDILLNPNDREMAVFKNIMRKYGMKFALKNETRKDGTEIVHCFVRAKDMDLMKTAFRDYVGKVEKMHMKDKQRAASKKMHRSFFKMEKESKQMADEFNQENQQDKDRYRQPDRSR